VNRVQARFIYVWVTDSPLRRGLLLRAAAGVAAVPPGRRHGQETGPSDKHLREDRVAARIVVKLLPRNLLDSLFKVQSRS
jgi:hypothetical protein